MIGPLRHGPDPGRRAPLGDGVPTNPRGAVRDVPERLPKPCTAHPGGAWAARETGAKLD